MVFNWLRPKPPRTYGPPHEPIEPILIKPRPRSEPEVRERLEPQLKKAPRINLSLLGAASVPPTRTTFEPPPLPRPLPGVAPQSATLAQDRDISSVYDYSMANGLVTEGLTFLGYPYLAELAQRPEYRHIVGTIAREATRKWISVHSTEESSDRVDLLVKAMQKFRVRELFQQIVEVDGFFGRAQLFIDTGYPLGDPELEKLLVVSPAKIGINGLKRLAVIEPMWTYPANYDARDPLSRSFYNPETWFVQGKRVHGSRLLTFVGNAVPDFLKPLYMFGGLSRTQMAKPYVDNWLQVRTDVSDLIGSFSISGIKTDMDAALSGDPGEGLLARIDLFNKIKSNRGTMALNRDTEDWFNIATPLGTLDKLQAQAQEQMASVSGIPLVKLLGITPSGLNASSEGEIRVFYDTLQAFQEDFFRPHLKRVLDIIQLSEFGNVDDGITFRFIPLWDMDESQRATIRQTNASAAEGMIQAGIISAAEERERLAREDDGLYNNIDLSVVPEIPGAEPPDGGPDGGDGDGPPDDSEDGPPPLDGPPGGQDAALPGPDLYAQDAAHPFTKAEWDEAKVKRNADGKFATSGGSKLTGISSIVKAALHPDSAKSEQTKKYLQSHHAKIDKALAHAYPKESLQDLKAKLPVNNYNNKMHYYLDHLIKEHEATKPEEHHEAPEPEFQELKESAAPAAVHVSPTTKQSLGKAQIAVADLPSHQFTEAWSHLEDLTPDSPYIDNPHTTAQLAVNEYLANLKADNGKDDIYPPESGQTSKTIEPSATMPESPAEASVLPLHTITYGPSGSGITSKGSAFTEISVHAATEQEAKKLAKKQLVEKLGPGVIGNMKVQSHTVKQPPPSEAPAQETHQVEGNEGLKWGMSNYKSLAHAGVGHEEALEQLLPQQQKALAGYTKEQIMGSSTNMQGVTTIPGKAPITGVPAPKSLSDKTKAIKQSLLDNMDKVLEKNKPSLTGALQQFDLAITAAQNGDVTMLMVQQPIPNPTGMAQKAANDYLEQAKIDLGVSAPPAALTPVVELTPAQTKVAAAINAIPHKKSHQVHHLEDAQGNEIAALLKTDTKAIPAGFYGKVNAVMAGDHAHAGNVSAKLTKLDPVLEEYAQHIRKQLEGKHTDAIEAYQDGSYDQINHLLNTGKTKYGAAEEPLQATIAALSEAVAKAPPVPADLPMYRGLSCHLKHLTGFDDPAQAVGRCFVHKNFASTTRSLAKAKDFSSGNTLMKFTLPAGSKGVVMKQQNWERELLLDKASMWRIDKVESGVDGHKTVVHCTYLGHKHDE